MDVNFTIELGYATPFRRALLGLRRKHVVPIDWSSEDWAHFVPEYFRQQAFFSAHTAAAQQLQTYKDFMTDFQTKAIETITRPDGSQATALKAGGRAQFVRDMKERFGGTDDEGGGPMTRLLSTTRTQLIFETQQRQAWGRGQWEEGNDPDILDYFPGVRLVRIGFVAEPREIHQDMIDSRKILRKDDIEGMLAMSDPARVQGGLGTIHAPLAFNSQCDWEDVTRDECVSAGLIGADERVRPPQTALNDHLEASIDRLDPDIRASLVQALGDNAFEDRDLLKFSWEKSK